MHRRQDAARGGNRLPLVIQLAKDRVHLLAVPVDRALLRLAQSPGHVALLERPASSRREHETIWAGLHHPELVPRQHNGELPRYWHRPRRTIRLCWPAIAMPVHLPPELDLGLVQLGDTNIGPRQPAQLGDPRTGQCRHSEQDPEWLVRARNRPLQLLTDED